MWAFKYSLACLVFAVIGKLVLSVVNAAMSDRVGFLTLRIRDVTWFEVALALLVLAAAVACPVLLAVGVFLL